MDEKPRKIAVTVTQDDDGNCMVWEHDLEKELNQEVGFFRAETRIVTTKGEFGPELANRDVAQIRAMIFATTMEKLVNEGKVDLG